MLDASFFKFEQIFPFFHLIFVITLISTQVVLILATNHFLKNGLTKYEQLFKILKTGEIIFFTTLFFIILTGIVLANGDSFKFSDPMIEGAIHTKFALSIFCLCNFLYIHYRLKLAQKAYKISEFDEVNEHLIVAIRYFIVLDICIILIAMYLGIVVGKFK
ncbi:hypothetical protein F1B92_07835 [Campylobacter sp. FMV-PI01]|uniref:3-isopropylmalate dehydratase n=1 Tax=Campylobacter portucalensis TaxID=2608384 RepID=A0A6L5WIU4_9BACT|nr:hypothetical protein [Campylobacter portucalensis]MSN97069.1 hypothetical protein [Campylobacter portucalensis]